MLSEYKYEDIDEDNYTAKQLEEYLNRQNVFIQKNNEANLLSKSIDLLRMWGICNAYSSKCGYKNVSAMFSELYPRKNFVYIENELEFIDECMREAKNSRDELVKEQQNIAELYYKGIDIVVDGSDWSEKLTLRDIAELKNISKNTVDRRLKAFESYIVSKLSKRDDIYY